MHAYHLSIHILLLKQKNNKSLPIKYAQAGCWSPPRLRAAATWRRLEGGDVGMEGVMSSRRQPEGAVR